MRIKLLNREGKWYRLLWLHEKVLVTDYVDLLPGRVKSFRLVEGSAGYSVRSNRKHFKACPMYYREIDPLLGYMVAAKQMIRARKKKCQ